MVTTVEGYYTDGCGRCKLFATPDCKVRNWQEALNLIRSIILESGLTEELKWGVPCYTIDGKNLLLIGAFKDYCAIMFLKGSLMKDPNGLLVQQTENVQGSRQLRFISYNEVVEFRPIIISYIAEAIEIEKAGLKIDYKKTNEFDFPAELTAVFETDTLYKNAFEALTPGRQRGYLLHFSAPKQAKTRMARIEKCRQLIFEGKGLND